MSVSPAPSSLRTSDAVAPDATVRRPRLAFDSRFVAPILITTILLIAHVGYGILEAYPKTLLAIATSILTELILGRVGHQEMAAPSQCLHFRDLMRYPGALPGMVALCPGRDDLDYEQVRYSCKRPPSVESVKPGNCRAIVPGSADRGVSIDSVGQ